MSAQSPASRVTVNSLRALKASAQPIVMLTAYDFPSAYLAEAAGVDCVLVGDSLGMTVLGHSSTLPVTMDDMVRATAAVSRATERVFIVADMPFLSYQVSIEDAVRNAGRLMAEAGAHAVKLEGADDDRIMTIETLVAAGIPVMAHVGLTPQSVNVLGGYRTQATDADSAAELMRSCVELERAGAFAIVLECIPAEIAERASALVSIPTIGIGAGAGCDGQVQVFTDILGLGTFTPRHAKRYSDVGEQIAAAIGAYAAEVRDRSFPGEGALTHVSNDVVAQAELVFGEMDLDDDEEFE